jgi:hypothetical protein
MDDSLFDTQVERHQAGAVTKKAVLVYIRLPGFEMPKNLNRFIIAELFN